MHSTIGDTTITITCTWEDLCKMDGLDLAVYATPSPDGRAAQVYLAQRPHYKYDFLLASLEDFEEDAGYELVAGWQDMNDEELAEHAEEEYSLTVPRTRPDAEA